RRPARSLTEAEFQEQVIGLARLLGWRVAHFRAAGTGHGWRTPVSADGEGFVDLVLARDRVMFVELKSDTGTLRPAQREWLIALRAAGAEVHVWKPALWAEVEATLRGRRP
ncbi:MAG: VRR-NUC domain-containing protein, partial [Actinobacteria bacterium]|nr:VRR-NUC domain-containing protein [Actinomycetota bacterium]